MFLHKIEKDIMTHGPQDLKKKNGRPRLILLGWDNYTDFEKEQIEKTKALIKQDYGIDLRGSKDFGPRAAGSKVVRDAEKARDGMDYHFSDANILRYIGGWHFDLKKACADIVYHLQWRQTNVPIPILQDKTLFLINSGMFYIHGRCFDGSPVVIFDVKHMIDFHK